MKIATIILAIAFLTVTALFVALRGEHQKVVALVEHEQSQLQIAIDERNQWQSKYEKASNNLAQVVTVLPHARVPVSVQQRQAMTGDGLVFVFQNQTAKLLPVHAELQSTALGKTNVIDLVFPPAEIKGGVKEIGHLEGWTAVPGDKVILTSQGYIPSSSILQ